MILVRLGSVTTVEISFNKIWNRRVVRNCYSFYFLANHNLNLPTKKDTRETDALNRIDTQYQSANVI